jgi:hypothetical protein
MYHVSSHFGHSHLLRLSFLLIVVLVLSIGLCARQSRAFLRDWNVHCRLHRFSFTDILRDEPIRFYSLVYFRHSLVVNYAMMSIATTWITCAGYHPQIAFRNFENFSRGKFLVNKSAICSSVLICSTLIFFSNTYCRK